MGNSCKNVAIVGGGIIGLMSAYYLAKAGHAVDVFEKDFIVGMQCSHANGGQMSSCNSETWHTASNVKNAIRWMFQNDAPLSLGTFPTIPKIIWLTRFMGELIKNTHYANSLATAKMALEASHLYDEILKEENISYESFSASKCGMMHLYTNQESFDLAKKSKKLFTEAGVEWNDMSAQDVISEDKNLSTFKNLVGGIHTSHDWVGDIFQFCLKVYDVLKDKYGVKFYFNSEVTSIWNGVERVKKNGNSSKVEYPILTYQDLKTGQMYHSGFHKIIVCNGHLANKLALQQFTFLGIYPVKGHSITIPLQDISLVPKVSLLDTDKKIVASTFNGENGAAFRVAGMAELVGNNSDISQLRINTLVNWVNDNFPSVSTEKYREWACLRPMTPSMMPILKQTKHGFIFHTGHGHLGWTLAPATAKKLVDMV